MASTSASRTVVRVRALYELAAVLRALIALSFRSVSGSSRSVAASSMAHQRRRRTCRMLPGLVPRLTIFCPVAAVFLMRTRGVSAVDAVGASRACLFGGSGRASRDRAICRAICRAGLAWR